MRFPCLFILAMTLAWPAAAQEDDTATSALQSVLSTLKDSAEKLSLDNDQMAARDKNIQQQIMQLQTQLAQLQGQGDDLKKAASQLQTNNAWRAREINRLQQEDFDLEQRAQKTQAGITLARRSLDAAYRQDEQMLLQLKAMSKALPQAPPQPVEALEPSGVELQTQKLKLMKMIYDSQQRQEALHESVLQAQKDMPLQPGADALAHQQLLKQQIKDLEAQLASYPPQEGRSPEAPVMLNDDQLRELQDELKDLQKNYVQLKGLLGQMAPKFQSASMSVEERIEEQKLQGHMEDLQRQAQGLRAQLDDLRSQMVDLDKRKSRLEEMVKQL